MPSSVLIANAQVSNWDRSLRTLVSALDHAGRTAHQRVYGLKAGARPFLLTRVLAAIPRPALVITADGKSAECFAADLRFLLGEPEDASPFARRVHHLPSWDVTPFEDASPPADVLSARIEGLYHLRQGLNPILVTTPESLLQKVPPLATFAGRYHYLVEGEELDRDTLAAQWIDWGYRSVPLVEDRGDLSVRGGIVDVYPPAHALPIRLQLDGDRIEALYAFDPVSQRRVEERQELLVLPVREFALSEARRSEVAAAVEARALELEIAHRERHLILDGLESGLLFPGVEFCLPYVFPHLDSVFDYLPDNVLLCIDTPAEVEAALEQARTRVERRAAERQSEHRFYPPPDDLFLTPAQWRKAVAARPALELEALDVIGDGKAEQRIAVRSFVTTDLKIRRSPTRRQVSFAPIAERLRQWREEGYRVFLVAGTDAQCRRLQRLLETHDMAVELSTEPFPALPREPAQPVHIVHGHFHAGFRLPDDKLLVVSEADLFGEARRRAGRAVSVGQLLKSLGELKPNDHVVHLDHGIGLYRGLKHLHVAGTEGDYLHLEYAGGDRLYLPADRISLVSKYVGNEDTGPKLDKLGGTAWTRVKQKTRESLLAMARELLAVHAAREIHERKAVSTPDAYYREFESSFPFEETPDQRRAIGEVLDDLGRTKPMDRLICGDVGYGKTEVALRAAFLTVMDGRQVAVLVPTTVLAQQHLDTFRRRFDGYPVRVEMLSRFVSPTHAKEVQKGIHDGTVDIVVGTHRLLRKDLKFARLGLLVIDEEHRFGVRHKERVKEMRRMVDVLTLTATPIPRTLQMSLLGIRDLSVIETAPIDRLAVRTYVTRYDDDVIRDAIERERQRDGQVFFVHNRVQNIEQMAKHVQTLVPQARVAVAHGQMREHALERVMMSFLNHEIDVLVCSAIIESGLDIPNANTILINRADRFGLAQLYQLRGRVGRSHERAYAYLMIPGEHLITRDARRRLQALQQLDDLGGGFRLAAEDLEIRGAGNMLGGQQSGHIASVGFELYTSMLEEAVRELRGEEVTPELEPELQLGFPAYLPDSYIPDENQRVVFYRRLAAVRDAGELRDLGDELEERYGPIPPLVDTFLRVMDLRRHLKACLVARAVLNAEVVTLQFHPQAPINADRLVALVRRSKGRCKLSSEYQLTLRPEQHDWDGLVLEVRTVLERLQEPGAAPGKEGTS